MTLEDDRRGRLVVVGTGIQLIRQMTLESVEQIKRADRLIYLTPNPATARWLEGLNARCESLADCYAPGRHRLETYDEMVERIVSAVRKPQGVCVAIHGHPGVGVYASHKAIAIARSEGFQARMLPGVSAEACLVADLGVDPVVVGWQSLEASDFVRRSRHLDLTCAVILWQPGTVGVTTGWFSEDAYRPGLQALREVLRHYYPEGHPIFIYQAPDFSVSHPIIQQTSVAALAEADVTSLSTLYIPPLSIATPRSLPS